MQAPPGTLTKKSKFRLGELPVGNSSQVSQSVCDGKAGAAVGNGISVSVKAFRECLRLIFESYKEDKEEMR